MENITQAKQFQVFEKLINYKFKNKLLLKSALSHPSKKNIKEYDYQRLEFLGDSVLNFIVTKYLILKYPNMNEGELTYKRANIINRKTLAKSATALSLNKYILTGNSINTITEKILCDTYEALIGAITLDSTIKDISFFIHKTLLDNIKQYETKTNHKGKLIELCRFKKIVLPKYHTTKENNHFISKVAFDKNKQTYYGVGKTKKEAEDIVSKEILKKL